MDIINKYGRIACFVTCFSAGLCHAQTEIRFERISSDDGLSQVAVRSILQDQYGFLWIATLDGLNRYDGKRFTVYYNKENDKNSLTTRIYGLRLREPLQDMIPGKITLLISLSESPKQ